jgi:hypothetical protein
MMVLRPEVKSALERLKNVPTDIEPIFATADKLAGASPVKAKSKKSK